METTVNTAATGSTENAQGVVTSLDRAHLATNGIVQPFAVQRLLHVYDNCPLAEVISKTTGEKKLGVIGYKLTLPGTELQVNTGKSDSRVLAMAVAAESMPDTAETAAFLKAILAYEGDIIARITAYNSAERDSKVQSGVRSVRALLNKS